MGIFDFLRAKVTPKEQEERAVVVGGLGFNSLSSFASDTSMNVSAFYCAVQQISNAVATLNMDIVEYSATDKKVLFEHPLNKVLNVRPDGRHTHFDFFKQMTESVILRGNGYALIVRDDRTLYPKQLLYLDSRDVNPMIQPDGTVKYLVNGMSEAVDASNMLDFHMHLDSNFRGVPLIRYAYQALKCASDADRQAGNFFSSGGNVSGVLKSSAPLTNEQKKQIIESWRNSFMDNTNSKPSVAVLPQGVDFQAVSLNSSDLELLSSREFNVVEIARFFCIPPSKLMIMDDVSYNSLEYAQINFMQDTVLPYTQMMEDEMNIKLFKPSQVGKIFVDFDFSTMFSTNKETEANYYKTLLVNGILSLNEVRTKLGFPNISAEDGGDRHWMQISYATTEAISSGKYIKGQDQAQTQEVDNNTAKKNE